MRAMVLRESGAPDKDAGALVLEDLPAPRPGPGEVAIAVSSCAVCRTDLHILDGEVPAALPRVLGHQAAGRVVEVGPGVESLRPGDAVGVGWLASTCGACRFCTSGRENLCEEAAFTGRDRDGGFAEILTAREGFAFRLPEELEAIQAAPLLCAGVIGYRSLKLSAIAPGGRLGLFGFGASAHLAIQIALHWGCSVYAFTREQMHRDLAISMGAVWAGGVGDAPPVALDAAVTFAPSGDVVAAALARLDRGAAVAVNAIHMTPIPPLEYSALYGERTVRSVQNATRQDARELLALAAKIPIRAETEAFALEDANEALKRIRLGKVRGAAVLEVEEGRKQ